MSQHQFAYHLRRELEQLNSIIDRKIVRGRDYRAEAARHKEILRSLTRMKKQRTLSLNFLSFFF